MRGGHFLVDLLELLGEDVAVLGGEDGVHGGTQHAEGERRWAFRQEANGCAMGWWERGGRIKGEQKHKAMRGKERERDRERERFSLRHVVLVQHPAVS